MRILSATLALVPGALLAGSLLAAAPTRAHAQFKTAPVTIATTRRIIGDYALGGGRVQVSITPTRVDLFIREGETRMVVLLDAPSVRWWLSRANALIASKTRNTTEQVTPALTHSEPTVASTVVLTRAAHGAPGARFYLTATLDTDNIAMLPLSKKDARIITSALKRAVEEMEIDAERAKRMQSGGNVSAQR